MCAQQRNGAKIVLVARRPEDCLVSYWHQLSALKFIDYSGDINHFFPLFMAGLLPHGEALTMRWAGQPPLWICVRSALITVAWPMTLLCFCVCHSGTQVAFDKCHY